MSKERSAGASRENSPATKEETPARYLEFRSEDSYNYMQDEVMPALNSGLRELVKVQPDNALEWLGNYLLNYEEPESPAH